MISAYDCLIVPVMTEKSMKSAGKTYIFQVDSRATKIDVRNAVEKVFNVKVSKVNVLNRGGKKKVFRNRRGETQARKFAMVNLSEGTINFEGGF